MLCTIKKKIIIIYIYILHCQASGLIEPIKFSSKCINRASRSMGSNKAYFIYTNLNLAI